MPISKRSFSGNIRKSPGIAACVRHGNHVDPDRFADTFKLIGQGRSGKAKEELLRGAGLAEHLGKRARKGRKAAGFVKLLRVAAQ